MSTEEYINFNFLEIKCAVEAVFDIFIWVWVLFYATDIPEFVSMKDRHSHVKGVEVWGVTPSRLALWSWALFLKVLRNSLFNLCVCLVHGNADGGTTWWLYYESCLRGIHTKQITKENI
jgi:hypothetical protein